MVIIIVDKSECFLQNHQQNVIKSQLNIILISDSRNIFWYDRRAILHFFVVVDMGLGAQWITLISKGIVLIVNINELQLQLDMVWSETDTFGDIHPHRAFQQNIIQIFSMG